MTVSVAVAVFVPSCAVIVYVPAVCDPHAFAEHDAPVDAENVVAAVTSPSALLNWSKPFAVYVCDPPAVIDDATAQP